MKRALLAGVAVAALMAGPAAAADLPRQMAVRAPVMPYYNWTGYYVRINAGGGWGDSDWAGVRSIDLSGGLIGVTLGYNWQFGQFVAGLEGDLNWTNIEGSAACVVVGTCRTRNDWLGTVRGRLGYAADRFMPYLTGGLAFGNVEASSPTGSADDTNAGWALGAGLEFALAGNWTAKVEYLYVDLGDITCATCFPGGVRVDYTASIVRGGLNFRF